MKRYFRSRSGIIAALGQPLMFLLALGFGLGPVFQRAGAGNYIQFLAPGLIGMTVLLTSVFFGAELIWDRQFGFLKETLVAPTPRLLIVIGRMLGGATVAMMQGIIVLFMCLAAGFRLTDFKAFPLAILFMALIAVTFSALGTLIACLAPDFQGFQLIVNFLVMPIFYLSGALFPLAGVSKTIALIARLNPLSYGIDGLRAALIGTGHFGLADDMAVLLVSMTGMLIIGSYLFSRIQVL
jgi:ABC-2 type transport system permease protein